MTEVQIIDRDYLIQRGNLHVREAILCSACCDGLSCNGHLCDGTGDRIKIDWSRFRRQLEDRLRKGTRSEFLAIAKILGVQKAPLVE